MRRISLAVVVATATGGALLIPAASAHHSGDLDCGDFSSQASAQYHMNAHPGDPDGLDGNDGDGRACESNPAPYHYGTATGPDQPQPAPTPSPAPAPSQEPSTTPEPEQSVRLRARVVSVTDGDTLKVRLSSGATRSVRLIGVDTSESRRPGTAVECGAKQATRAMRKLALHKVRRKLRGEKIRPTSDPTQDATDAYGRMLAYVNRRRDGKDVGKAMVRAGWAGVYVYDNVPFQRVDTYTAAQQSASGRNAGVWGRCGGDFHRPA